MDWNGTSTEIDQRLGFRVEAIERDLLLRAKQAGAGGNHHTWGPNLHGGNQTWVGLHPESIQTPYEELLRLCEKLTFKSGDSLIDLGAGYGRLGVVLHHLYPEVRFTGIEFVPERVAEGKRVFATLGISPELLREGDLTREDFSPGIHSHYFIYDFGKVPHIRRLLNQLGSLAGKHSFTVTGRGKGIRSLVSHEFPWLTAFYEEENFSIYSL